MRKMRNGAITIVSGLPRCGTSMMMKMLEAGGIEPVVDNIRQADEDNPKGYYEFEKVKKIQHETSWLDNTHGKVFKMVSMLLYHLPQEKPFKIIFMRRNMAEMLASQRKMLERQGKPDRCGNDEEMARIYEKHLQDIETWLANQSNVEVLYINYNEVLKSPRPQVEKIQDFLGDPLDEENMVKVVDESLYRQRK